MADAPKPSGSLTSTSPPPASKLPPPDAVKPLAPASPNSSEKKRRRRRRRRSRKKRGKKKSGSPPVVAEGGSSNGVEEEEPPEFGGESLSTCTDDEWDFGEDAYDTELINMKKKQNGITVFAAPKKDVSTAIELTSRTSSTTIIGQDPGLMSPRTKNGDNADLIGQIVAGVVRKFMQGRANDSVNVEIRLTSTDGSLIASIL